MPTAQDLGNDVLFNLREPGVNWGGLPSNAANADYAWTAILYQLNLALRDFVSKTGFAPSISEKHVVSNITPGQDYPLPADLVALIRVEYAISGAAFKPLPELSFDEFDSETGLQANVSAQGPPRMYREPFGQTPNQCIRWNPYPTPGNAGIAYGSFVVAGPPAVGDSIALQLVYGATTVNVGPYIVLPTDTIATITIALANLLNASAAVVGVGAFIAAATTVLVSGQVNVQALLGGVNGNLITIASNVASSAGLTVTPGAPTNLSGGNAVPDQVALYYSANGGVLVLGTDVPGIPDTYHEALACWTLERFWLRKNDAGYAKFWKDLYTEYVVDARKRYFNLNQAKTFGFQDPDESVDGLPGDDCLRY